MNGYYDGPDLESRVLDALRTAGRPLDRIDPDDLAGLDEFHALGRAGTLADRAALADQVTVIEGDGRALPFAGAGFDVAWAQAVWQSIDDKVSLTREIHRVLRPGGRLALLEVLGDDQELRYPVPWADGPAQSFVVPGDELALLLTGAGFAIEAWWCAGGDAQAAIAAATADTGRMGAGLPGSASNCSCPTTRRAWPA
jgi:SAM-dependent methyltransferase